MCNIQSAGDRGALKFAIAANWVDLVKAGYGAKLGLDLQQALNFQLLHAIDCCMLCCWHL